MVGPEIIWSDGLRGRNVSGTSAVGDKGPSSFGLRGRAAALLAVFLIVYNIAFQGLESLSSARLTVLLLVIVAAISKKNARTPVGAVDPLIFLVFVPVPYVLVQFLLVRDFGQLSRFLHLFLYSYVGAILLARMVGGANRWFLVFLVAASIQAFILLFSFVSLDYRAWAAASLATGGNFGAENIYRAPGFTSDSGSSLSVIQSMGVLAGGFCLFFDKSMAFRWRAFVFALMLLCTLSCAVVGRTGLILSVIFVGLFVRVGVVGSGVVVSFGVFLLFLMGAAIGFVQEMLPSNFSIEYFSGWLFGFLYGEDQTAGTLGSMPIAPLSLDTILGYGLVSVVDGENPSGHDSGFIQGYFSMGLLVSVLFYCFYAFVLVRLLKWLPSKLRYFIAFLLFAIEVKEPFVFKYAVMFLLVGTYFSWCAFENRTDWKHEDRLPH